MARIVCVSTEPDLHHTAHEPGDCYCDVYCRHGHMECVECPDFPIEGATDGA